MFDQCFDFIRSLSRIYPDKNDLQAVPIPSKGRARITGKRYSPLAGPFQLKCTLPVHWSVPAQAQLAGRQFDPLCESSAKSSKFDLRFGPVSLILAALLLLALPAQAVAQSAHFSFADFTLGGAFSTPSGVAVDAGGNVYVADTGNSLVKEIPAGCLASSCVVTLGGSNTFKYPQAVAVDASGNVFVADLGNQLVKEILAVNGSIPSTNPTINTLGSGFKNPSGVAVDSNGNVYVADWGNVAVFEIMKAGGYATVNTLGGGFSHPQGVAVDKSGNIFVADGGKQFMSEIPSGCTSSTCVTQVGGYSFTFQPIAVAVDVSGDVFAVGGSAQTKSVYKILAVGGSIPSTNPAVITLGSGLSEPTGIAADSSGNVYVADYMNNRVQMLETQAVNFGAIPIGQTAASISLTFTFDTAGTIGGPAALTQGAPGLDFAVASGGTCTAGTAYTSGDTCTVNVSFRPKFAGPRNGAVILKDGSGNSVATACVYGIGSGPQAGFHVTSRQLTAFPNLSFAASRGIAVDGSGNLFVSSVNSGGAGDSVVEVPAGCTAQSCVKQLPGTFGWVQGLAVDGAGNLWVGDVGAVGSITEILAASGYSTSKVHTGSFGFQVGVAVDGTGNVYFTSGASGSAYRVVELLASSGYATAQTLTSGYNPLGGIAVDGSGDVFFADPFVHVVQEIIAVNGSIPSTPTIKSLGSGLRNLSGIALDGGGNLYALGSDNSGFGLISELAAAPGYSTVIKFSNQTNPVGIALDAGGNLFGIDYASQALGGTSSNTIFELPRSAAPSLVFSNSTAPGVIDYADGPHQVLIENIGNQPLSVAGLTVSNGNFSLDANTTTCTASTTLAVGDSCLLAILFNPLTTGANITGTVSVTDNTLNAPSVTQTISLSGKSQYTPVVNVSLASYVIAVSQALPVTVTVDGGSGNPTPTGTMQITAPGYNSGTLTLSGGSVAITIPSGTLSPGQSAVLATYQPDAASASNYTPASLQVTFIVTLTIMNVSPRPDLRLDCV